MADLNKHMRRIVADLRKKYGDEAIVGADRHAAPVAASKNRPRWTRIDPEQGGRPRYTDAYRARVAADYVDACQQAPAPQL